MALSPTPTPPSTPRQDESAGGRTLSVLPFQNLAGRDDDHFAEGIIEDLLVDLMAGGVAASNFSHEASSFGGDEGGPPDVGQVVVVIDPTATAGDGWLDRFEHEFAALSAEPGVRLQASGLDGEGDATPVPNRWVSFYHFRG